jgi:hypothetical protein
LPLLDGGVEVAVVDGDQDLGAVSAVGGQGVGGEGGLDGADEPVEAFLPLGAVVQVNLRDAGGVPPGQDSIRTCPRTGDPTA